MLKWFTKHFELVQPLHLDQIKKKKIEQKEQVKSQQKLPEDQREYTCELDRYTHYLELKIKFHEYETMTDEEREIIKVQRDRQDRQMGAGTHWEDEKGNIIEPEFLYTSSAHSISTNFPKQITTLPMCEFGCGCSPCGCHSAWSKYLSLKKIYDSFLIREKNNFNRGQFLLYTTVPNRQWILKRKGNHKFILPIKQECAKCKMLKVLRAKHNGICDECIEEANNTVSPNIMTGE